VKKFAVVMVGLTVASCAPSASPPHKPVLPVVTTTTVRQGLRCDLGNGPFYTDLLTVIRNNWFRYCQDR
jgi:hypothetical protein